MSDAEVGEDLTQLAFSLGYAWPDDDAGRWRVLKLMAKRAAHWRQEVHKYSTETLREVERQKLYDHQKKRLIAQTRKVANLRRALKEFMTFQVAWLRENNGELITLKTIEHYGKDGYIVSVCYGPCGDNGTQYSVTVLDTKSGNEFAKPFGASDFESVKHILVNEVQKLRRKE